jgi:hypothetical protein
MIGLNNLKRNKMKQETLEEATQNYVDYCACNISENEDLADADKRGFIYGAKWQQERMYSEEEAYKIWKAGQEYWKTSGESITFEELTEQFKKK